MSKFGTLNPPAGTTTLCWQFGIVAPPATSMMVLTPVGNGNAGRLSTCRVPALLVRLIRIAPQQDAGVVVVVLVVTVVVVVVEMTGHPPGAVASLRFSRPTWFLIVVPPSDAQYRKLLLVLRMMPRLPPNGGASDTSVPL